MHSSVVFIEKATPASITEFHDILSNDLISVKENWSFEFKTFRLTVRNLPPDSSKLMHAITFAHRDNQSVVIKNKSAIVTSPTPGGVPQTLLHNGCSTGTPSSFDHLLSSKLSNLWTQRQNIKGDFGSTYNTSGLVIRATNVFSYGGFKGLLIEIECAEPVSSDEFQTRVKKVGERLKEMGVQDYKICSDTIDPNNPNFICDLAYQYVKVLEL